MNAINLGETLTVSEVQRILKIGNNTVYNLIHSNSFPVRKVGRSYRIPAGLFYQWLTEQRTGTGLSQCKVNPHRIAT